MIVNVEEPYREFYEQGHLDFALRTYAQQGSFEKWAEYLLTQPVASFTNDTEWRLDGGKVVWEDEDGEREEYKPTMVIENDGEVIFHCADGSQSMFYKLLEDGSTLIALYVD